jgi:hypothetical protein
MMKEGNLTQIISTYVNITIDPPIQLLHANKILKNKNYAKE